MLTGRLRTAELSALTFLFEFMTAMMALVKLTDALLLISRSFPAMRTHLHYLFDGVENDLCPYGIHASIIHAKAYACKAHSCARRLRLSAATILYLKSEGTAWQSDLEIERAEERSASALKGTINQCTVAVAVGFNMDLPTPTLRVCFVQDLHNASSTRASTAQSDLRQTVASSLTTR